MGILPNIIKNRGKRLESPILFRVIEFTKQAYMGLKEAYTYSAEKRTRKLSHTFGSN